MIGTPVERKNRKLDTVLVAARYDPSHKLQMARAFERRYAVWSDLVLLDRGQVLERLRSGRNVVTGHTTKLPGDFVVLDRVRLIESDGQPRIAVGEPSRDREDLRLPQF